MFEFQLVITEKCNLACDYCYMNNRPLDMSPEVFDRFYKKMDSFLRLYGQEFYNTAFFGGEPLLNWSMIEYITNIVKQDDRCKGLMVATNGLLLTKEKREFLKENNIVISVSFDGLWNQNNRPLLTGESSLEKYLERKDLILADRGSKVMVSPDSISTMVENYKFFIEEMDIPKPDFTLVRDDIWSDDDVKRFKIEAERLADQVIEYIQQGRETNVGFFELYTLDMIFGKIQGKRPFSCFAGVKGMGFMPDGFVYPCARFGSNRTSPLYDSNTDSFFFHNIEKFLDDDTTNPCTFEKCKVCELYQYCNAGCTYSQLEYGGPVDNVCKLLKILYKETIRINKMLKNNSIYQQMLKGLIRSV